MLILKKHEHCEDCKKPITTDHIGGVSDELLWALRETDADSGLFSRSQFSRRVLGWRGLCDECAMKRAKNAVRAAIVNIKTRSYARGYEREPNNLGGCFCLSVPSCAFCERTPLVDVDMRYKNANCPKCGREYGPRTGLTETKGAAETRSQKKVR